MQFYNSFISNLVLVLTLTFYLIVASYSCIYAIRRLLRPGVSNEVRYYFLRKHLLYVITFSFIWIIYLSSPYYHLLTDDRALDGVTPAKPTARLVPDYLTTLSSFSMGIGLTLIRINEPLFRFLIKKKFYEMWGILIDEDGEKTNKLYLSDTLQSFLTSSLNIELVNIIL
jgi:hypothetical protein